MTTTSGWREVGDRCFARRYEPFDVTCGVVVGDAGLLVIDTRMSTRQGRALVDDLSALSSLPVHAVLNTHLHFDHTYGNAALRERWPDVPLVAHETVPADLVADECRIKDRYRDEPDDPCRDEVLATDLVTPDAVFSSVWSVELGGCYVEAVHPGRGHTAGDVVVRVPSADVVYAGDLVEESAPPAYGPDSWPLEWPQTVELVVGLLSERTVVVPGHGAPVGKDFVLGQRVDLADVAGQVQALAAAGVPVDDAVARGSWPFGPELVEHAVRRGYAHLARP
ncbi:MAG: MBL fold metallo-hydrolase [Nocardioidaceae bacterium]|nr:MBL fold metallo-hydrolase [Nocardioidaceae bacterium]